MQEKTYFFHYFYFTHSHLQNTHIGLSILHSYLIKYSFLLTLSSLNTTHTTTIINPAFGLPLSNKIDTSIQPKKKPSKKKIQRTDRQSLEIAHHNLIGTHTTHRPTPTIIDTINPHPQSLSRQPQAQPKNQKKTQRTDQRSREIAHHNLISDQEKTGNHDLRELI